MTSLVMKQKTIPIKDINIGERFRKEYGDLEELKVSLSLKGLINAITVQQDLNGVYTLAAGGRRLAAATELGWESIDARIFIGDDLDLREVELFENIHRKDLTWAERSKLISEIDELQREKYGDKAQGKQSGWGMKETAEMLGVSRATVARDIQMAKAIEIIPELKECENQFEARRVLKRLGHKLDLDEKYETKTREVAEDKRNLIDCYQVGDVLQLTKDFEPNSFDIIEADPPYGISYQELIVDWEEDWADWTEAEYPVRMRECMKHFHRLLAPNGWLIVWLASRRLDITIDILESIGFRVSRVPAIWAKTNGGCMQPRTQLRINYEPFLYCHKGTLAGIANHRGNVYTHAQSIAKVHPTEKPYALMKEILHTFGRPGDKVLIPFAGSGNSIKAARDLGMAPYGFDLSEKNKKNYVVSLGELHEQES